MSRINASATRRSCRSVTGILSFMNATCKRTVVSVTKARPCSATKVMQVLLRPVRRQSELIQATTHALWLATPRNEAKHRPQKLTHAAYRSMHLAVLSLLKQSHDMCAHGEAMNTGEQLTATDQ
jgi:hypothetical protein